MFRKPVAFIALLIVSLPSSQHATKCRTLGHQHRRFPADIGQSQGPCHIPLPFFPHYATMAFLDQESYWP
jgi:hypothetical protein